MGVMGQLGGSTETEGQVGRRRALVLGAGGHTAHAWEIGFSSGLADGGIDFRGADLFVGTSAGAVVAGRLADGYEASFLVVPSDPMSDFDVLKRIQLRVKQGCIIQLAH